jgi:GNAT superfamily N-acetyltransferase
MSEIAPDIAVRLATYNDVPDIARFYIDYTLPAMQSEEYPARQNEIIAEYYVRNAWECASDLATNMFWLATIPVKNCPSGTCNELVGISGYSIRSDEVHSVYTARQGLSIGSVLMRAVLENPAFAKDSAHLYVVRSNKRAIKFYERFGFQIANAGDWDIGEGYKIFDYTMEYRPAG